MRLTESVRRSSFPLHSTNHRTMEKIAADAKLTGEDLQKIAAFGFGVALAAPVVALGKEQVKQASDALLAGFQKSAKRMNDITELLRSHIAGASA